MKNLFFDLPKELQDYIYELDRTRIDEYDYFHRMFLLTTRRMKREMQNMLSSYPHLRLVSFPKNMFRFHVLYKDKSYIVRLSIGYPFDEPILYDASSVGRPPRRLASYEWLPVSTLHVLFQSLEVDRFPSFDNKRHPFSLREDCR